MLEIGSSHAKLAGHDIGYEYDATGVPRKSKGNEKVLRDPSGSRFCKNSTILSINQFIHSSD